MNLTCRLYGFFFLGLPVYLLGPVLNYVFQSMKIQSLLSAVMLGGLKLTE